MPPVVDLSAGAGPLWDAAVDAADRAVLSALRGVPGAVALWRSWRLAADGTADLRVYLAEVDASPGDVADAAQRLTTAVADEATIVLCRPTTAELPAAPLTASALLWAANAGEPVTVVRVYDEVDPQLGPIFHPGHPRIDESEREAVAHYLDTGAPLLTTPQLQPDVLDPARGSVVPMNFFTDGRWVWTDTVGYYLRAYGLAPDERLLAAVREAGYTAPEVSAVAVHRARSAIFQPAGPEFVRTA